MSVLDDVFQEEYDRLLRMQTAMSRERELLPSGYISAKRIHGKQYYYLQQRQAGKVISSYIPEAELDTLRGQIEKRRQLDASLREIRENMKKLERVIP